MASTSWIGLDWIGTRILPGEAFSHEATLPGTQDGHTYTHTHNTVNQHLTH